MYQKAAAAMSRRSCLSKSHRGSPAGNIFIGVVSVINDLREGSGKVKTTNYYKLNGGAFYVYDSGTTSDQGSIKVSEQNLNLKPNHPKI